MALLAAFQSPGLIADGYLELQHNNASVDELQKRITDIDKQVAQLWKDVAGNDATSLADRGVEKRNNIDANLRSQINILSKERIPLQMELNDVQNAVKVRAATLTEVSAYIRMFGLGVLGALGGLLGACSANSEPIFAGVSFSRSVAGVVFGGFAGLIGYGLVSTGQISIPYLQAATASGASTNFVMIVVCLVCGAFAQFFYELLASWLPVVFPRPPGLRAGQHQPAARPPIRSNAEDR